MGPANELAPHVRYFLRRTPTVLVPLALLAFFARLTIGTLSWFDAAITIVLIVGNPFSEWIIHRGLQHSSPITIGNRSLTVPQTVTHRRHHDHPWEPSFILLGQRRAVEFVAVQSAIVLLAALFVFRSPVPALTAFTVAVGLTLYYEWTHFLIHTAYRPKSQWYQKRWTNHRQHHFRNESRCFGINGLIADRVLRTAHTHT